MEHSDRFVYRICSVKEFQEAQIDGFLRGNDFDKRSGFIHLSRKSQISGTLELFFPGRDDLMLLVLDSEKLAQAGKVQYDETEHGVFFPHFYGSSGELKPLPLSAVVESHKLTLENGLHVVPTSA